MARWGSTGETANGLYVWATNMIVVQEITQAVIRRVAQDLVETGDLEKIGQLIHSSDWTMVAMVGRPYGDQRSERSWCSRQRARRAER